jgi:hypothetical protein
MLSVIFERFAQASPVSVMVRSAMERVFNPETLDTLFEETAQRQYTRELLFSTVVSLMSLVVCSIRPSVSAAYKAYQKEIGVSKVAFYSKLNGIEPQVSQALVRHSAQELGAVIEELGGNLPAQVPGYRVKIIDGNALGATEHRLEVLRDVVSGPLPGKSLVVLDPSLMLAIDEFPCEDAYTQERALLEQVLETVEVKDLWIADRNFCTRGFLLGIGQREGAFVIREHQQIPLTPVSPLEKVFCGNGNTLFEQSVQCEWQGKSWILRRVVVKLDEPTQNGETEIVLLTNLPIEVADAQQVAGLYLERWSVEGLFQVITDVFRCEIKTLGYPKAALFSFCMALVAYNILAMVKASLRAVHGAGKIEAGISNYYLVEEIQAHFAGMMIALPNPEWECFYSLSVSEFSMYLKRWAALVDLNRFASSPRAKKKEKPKLESQPHRPHVSTARLLSNKLSKAP